MVDVIDADEAGEGLARVVAVEIQKSVALPRETQLTDMASNTGQFSDMGLDWAAARLWADGLQRRSGDRGCEALAVSHGRGGQRAAAVDRPLE